MQAVNQSIRQSGKQTALKPSGSQGRQSIMSQSGSQLNVQDVRQLNIQANTQAGKEVVRELVKQHNQTVG